MFNDPPPKARWRRSQRFTLSDRGGVAETSYMSGIVASRTEAGRASFDAARTSWAQTFGVQPDDGLYLAEVRRGPVDMQAIVEALETCGKTRKDAVAAMGRLFDAGFIATTEP
jgi:hypothetical protein